MRKTPHKSLSIRRCIAKPKEVIGLVVTLHAGRQVFLNVSRVTNLLVASDLRKTVLTVAWRRL